MLVKYIDEKNVEKYRGYVIDKEKVYVNDEKKALEKGFKNLTVEEQPTRKSEEEMIESYYAVKDNTIIQKWKEVENKKR